MAKSKVNKRKILYWTVGLILGIYALSMLIPCWFLVINSFKEASDYTGSLYKDVTNAFGVPRKFTFGQYKVASEECAKLAAPIYRLYINSVIFTAASTLLATVATVITAYACARFQFRGQGIILGIGVGALVFPDFGSASVIYKFYHATGLLNTWGVLWPNLNPFGLMFLIVYSQFRTISATYAEAAKIDGASELRIMIQIMIPMIKGTVGMMVVMSAIGSWNNYYTSWMYLRSYPTIALGMYEITQNPGVDRPIVCAIMVLCIIPLVVLFVSMRDTIISNTAAGGLKG